MSYKTTLPWRKFPRDAINNPALRFIINRMDTENRHAVFTLFTVLYCQADDDGFVDISDAELFADQCLMTPDLLTVLLQHFENRKLIERLCEEAPVYRIVDWLSPYPQAGQVKSAAERQKEYRERKKAQEAEKERPGRETEPAPAQERSYTRQEKRDDGASDTTPSFNEHTANAEDEINADISEIIKKNEHLTDEAIIRKIQSYKRARKNGANRRTALIIAVTEEDEMHTPSVTASCEVNPIEQAAGAAEPAALPADAESETVTPSVTDGVTECNALRGVTPPLRLLRVEIREDKKESESKKETEKESEKHTETKIPESAEAVKAPAVIGDDNAVQALEQAGKEEEKGVCAHNWSVALWQSVGRQCNELDELKKSEVQEFYGFLSSDFEKLAQKKRFLTKNDMTALSFLSIYLARLPDEKNSAAVVASQFVGVFHSLIRRGAFVGYEECTAHFLCSSVIFEPVFLKVEQILHTKSGGGQVWDRCLRDVLAHLKYAEAEMMRRASG